MKRKTNSLHYETVTQVLMNTLLKLMEEPLFDPFVLVGGTNLSLRLGHRISDDIDLFTDAEYGSIHFDELERFMQKAFPYYDKPDKSGITGLGSSYYVGLNEGNCVKLDLMYADAPFFDVCEIHDRIRMATQKQIAAMKWRRSIRVDAKKTGGTFTNCSSSILWTKCSVFMKDGKNGHMTAIPSWISSSYSTKRTTSPTHAASRGKIGMISNLTLSAKSPSLGFHRPHDPGHHAVQVGQYLIFPPFRIRASHQRSGSRLWKNTIVPAPKPMR